MKNLLSQLAGRITGTTMNVRPVIAPLFAPLARDAVNAPLTPMMHGDRAGDAAQIGSVTSAAHDGDLQPWPASRTPDAPGETAGHERDVRIGAVSASPRPITGAGEAAHRQSGRVPHEAGRFNGLQQRADVPRDDDRAVVESSSPVGTARDAVARGAPMSNSTRDRGNDRDHVHDHLAVAAHAAIAGGPEARRHSSTRPRLVRDGAADGAGIGRGRGDLRPRAGGVEPTVGLPASVLARLRALGESVAALEAASAQQAAPQIRVTVGCIEVRSQAAAIAAPAIRVPDRAPAPSAITLAKYLDRRQETTP